MKNLFESIDDAIVDLKSGRRVKDGLQVVLLFLVLKVDAESDGIGLTTEMLQETGAPEITYLKWEGSIRRHNPDCLVVTMVDYNDVPREVRIPYDMLQKHNTPSTPSRRSMTGDEIRSEYDESVAFCFDSFFEGVRAAEAFHGITS